MELTARQQKVKEVWEILRDYQKEVFTDMVRAKRWLNYLDMGMGKSLVTATAIMYLESFPCIIVCTKSAMGVWQHELNKWFGEEAVIYAGKPKQREGVWKDFSVRGLKFIITNYRLAKELGGRFGIDAATKSKGVRGSGTSASQTPPPGTKRKVGGLIADEIQRSGLFNHKTETYGLFKKLCKDIPAVYLLTGTPYRKGVVDIFGPLSIVAPNKFDSYWKFVDEWCVKLDTGFGASIERTPKNVIAFRAMLRTYASVLKKQDYLHELPGKIRQPIPIELDDEQSKAYHELVEDMYTETASGELIMAPIGIALMVRLRQLLICPQELGLTTKGTAIETILEMSEDLVDDKRPFVIFTPFKAAVKWATKALEEYYPGINVFAITGELTADEFTRTWQDFQNATSGSASVLICVIRSGASFHATVADTAFFLGYEWDPTENEQSEDRLNRMGQQKLVSVYYPMYRGTVDEDVMQRLNDKTYGANLLLSNEAAFRSIIAKRGLKL